MGNAAEWQKRYLAKPGVREALLCFNCNTIKALRLKRGGRTAAEMLQATAGKTRWRK